MCALPRGRVLLGRLLVVERQRGVRAWQLLYGWQRQQPRLHCLSRGDIQRERVVGVTQRVLGVSCGVVLLGGMQLVGRQRALFCWFFFFWLQRHIYAVAPVRTLFKSS